MGFVLGERVLMSSDVSGSINLKGLNEVLAQLLQLSQSELEELIFVLGLPKEHIRTETTAQMAIDIVERSKNNIDLFNSLIAFTKRPSVYVRTKTIQAKWMLPLLIFSLVLNIVLLVLPREESLDVKRMEIFLSRVPGTVDMTREECKDLREIARNLVGEP